MTSSVARGRCCSSRRIACCFASSREKTMTLRGEPAVPFRRRSTSARPSDPVPPVMTTVASSRIDMRGPSPRRDGGAAHADAWPVGQPPAAVVVELETLERIVRQEQVPVEIDPVGERRDGGRCGDPDRRLLHAAEERPESELARSREHPMRRADTAALGELDVDTGDDADETLEILDRDGALVRDDR